MVQHREHFRVLPPIERLARPVFEPHVHRFALLAGEVHLHNFINVDLFHIQS